MNRTPELQFANNRGIRLPYIEFGEGTDVLLAFHGYGQSVNDMKMLASTLGRQYKIYSFGLFFHGPGDFPIKRLGRDFPEKRHIRDFFSKFLKEKNIETFSLAGYSIGGKMALSMFEIFEGSIHSLYLFAPDGLKKNNWVKFVTSNRIGKSLYKRFLKNPWFVHGGVRLLRSLKLVSAKTADFVVGNTLKEEQRLQVYRLWMAFRYLEPDLNKIYRAVGSGNYKVHLFFGKFDEIIPPSTGRKFLRRVRKNARLHIIYTGHRLLGEKTRKYLENHPSIYMVRQ